eukprot:scaffold2191_cov254-Pinguiococcus_pyrenoidosus.AAC.36
MLVCVASDFLLVLASSRRISSTLLPLSCSAKTLASEEYPRIWRASALDNWSLRERPDSGRNTATECGRFLRCRWFSIRLYTALSGRFSSLSSASEPRSFMESKKWRRSCAFTLLSTPASAKCARRLSRSSSSVISGSSMVPRVAFGMDAGGPTHFCDAENGEGACVKIACARHLSPDEV